MALLSVSEVKAILRIGDGSKDEAIEILIPLVEDILKRKCRDDFTEGYPPGLKLPGAMMIGWMLRDSGVSAEKIGDYSVQYAEGMPKEIENLLKPYRRVKFV